MAFTKKLGNSGGLSRKFGSAVPTDENSNKSTNSGSKRIGPIKGRVSMSKGGHGAGTSLLGNGNGLARGFGNALPYEEGKSNLPSRGKSSG